MLEQKKTLFDGNHFFSSKSRQIVYFGINRLEHHTSLVEYMQIFRKDIIKKD